MKRLVMAMSALLMIVACDKEDKNTMIVEGNIEGLKMGTIYLQQYVNDKLTNIDSVVANGDGKFTFKRHLESPEVFYIYLDLKKQAGTDLGDRLMFFGEPTTININSAYDMFEVRANISGSQSQKEYNEYLHTMRQFGMRNAQLLDQPVNAFKAGKTSLADAPNTRVKYLDSIYGKLNKDVANSKYGKEFKTYIEIARKSENESIKN